MCHSLNLQEIIYFACPNRSCGDRGLLVSSMLGVLSSTCVYSQSFMRKGPVFWMPLSGNTACASTSINPKLFRMSPPYLPICGIYLPFQVNLHGPLSKPSRNNLFCMPEPLMWWQGLLVSSMLGVLSSICVYSLSFTRKGPVIGIPSSMLKSKR